MLGHNAFLPLPRAAFTDVAGNAIDRAFNEGTDRPVVRSA